MEKEKIKQIYQKQGISISDSVIEGILKHKEQLEWLMRFCKKEKCIFKRYKGRC